MTTQNIRRAATGLLMMLLTATTAWAQETISGLTYNTAGGYYEINDAQDLIDLATYVNAGNDASWKTFRQTADITFSHSSDWNNSGSSESNFSGIGTKDLYFKGSYYGQGFTISGLRMSVYDERVGLFRNVNNATIDGIVLADSRITGYHYTGGIVGYTYRDGGSCIVSNCHVRSDVLIHVIGDNVLYHGGIAGYNSNGCVVTNCTSAATMTGDTSCSFFGGIVGYNQGTISNSIAMGVTIGNVKSNYGAIAGFNSNNVLINNYYFDCTVQDSTSGIGVQGSDYTANNGAVNTSPDHFTASGDEYTIKSVAGWSVFCECLNHNARYSRFSGKTVKLGANIEVSRMAGSDSHDFCGTFDGQENTLTFNYGTASAYSNEQYIAPFSYVSNIDNKAAAIKDLHVAGDIYTSAKYAAGLVAQHWGTLNIENCRVSTVIHSSVSGDGTHGGFEAVNVGTLNIKGCVFDGKLLSTGETATKNCGGFVGWHNGGTTNISNSLYAPGTLGTGETEVGTGTVGDHPSATFGRDAVNSISNSYYTRTLGTAQGKQMHSITAGANVTLPGISGTATAYSVSGITAYSLTPDPSPTGEGSFSPGLKYGDVLYAGNGDAVSLTLSHTTPAGYSFSGYTVSAGTLQGTTLAMPDQDVTVSATYTPTTYTITYNSNGGTLTTDHNTYTIESPTITLDQPTRTGYTFGGWYTNSGLTGNAVTTIDHGSTGNKTFWAKWTPITYTVHYMGNGHTGGAMSDQTLTYDIEQNLTANAFSRAFTVTYNYNEATGGNNDATATATATFNGWATSADGTVAYANQQSVSNLTTVSETVNLYAKWTDGSVTLPAPTKTGYIFGGWYSDAGLTTSVGTAGDSYTPSADIILYAKWKTDTYTITYHLNEGTLTTDKTSYTIESADITLDQPTRTGYTFGGWYTNSGLTGDAVTTIAHGSTGHKTFYAKWTPDTYTITYHLNGGTFTTDKNSYTIESAAITLDVPTRTGFTFDGWYDNSGLTGDAVTTIAHGSTGHKTFWAKWLLTDDWETASQGTEDDPYMIYTKEQLDQLAQRVKGGNDYMNKYFKLGADITYEHETAWNDATSTESNYTAIGFMGTTTIPFRGHFDGANHVVSGIRIYKDNDGGGGELDNYCQGLFGYIEYGEDEDGYQFFPEVKNVILADARITGLQFIGGIVGNNARGTIKNCHVLSDVTIHAVQDKSEYSQQSPENHGGIAGFNSGLIDGCTSAASITIADGLTNCQNFGGIVGINGVTVRNCLYLGSTLEGTASVGAIAGRNNYSGTSAACIVENCYYIDDNIKGKDKDGSDIDDYDCAVGYNDDETADTESNVTNCGPITTDDNTFITMMARRTAALTDVAHTTPITFILYGRKLYKDGAWNTLCLPFSISDINATAKDEDDYIYYTCPLHGATVKELVSSSFEDGTLTMNFTEDAVGGDLQSPSIEAGKPYIVKWSKPDGYEGHENVFDIYEPEFKGVTLSSTTPGTTTTDCVDFIGTYSPAALTPNDKTNLFLGAANMLYYPCAANYDNGTDDPTDDYYRLKDFRAYFHLKNGLTAGDPALSRIALNFDGGEATGITTTDFLRPDGSKRAELERTDYTDKAGAWFTLDGRKLDGKPTKAGLYIHGGRKVVVK